MEHFEQQFPLEARSREIKAILDFLIKGQSCQLISVPGAGRSTVLRLLAYHKELRKHHLKDKEEAYLWVYFNFAEMASFETPELTKALFLAIMAAIKDMGPENEPWTSIGKEIYALFKEALALNDPLVLFQYLKRAMQQISALATPVFLFDRFSEFADKTTGDFFTQLRALRSASNNTLGVVFSTHKPLEELLMTEHWKDFYEFFVDNHIYLALADEATTNYRIKVIEKEEGKALEDALKKKLIKVTGGHGKLMKLGTTILLAQQPTSDITDSLLDHVLIKGSLLEIWQSVTREEKQALKEEKQSAMLANLSLPFPLLSEFIKRNIVDAMVPKTIRLDEKVNEVYFGDEAIADITASEFKLLSFLIKNPNRVCDREEIITAVYTDNKTQEGVSDEALDQMIHRLRKKIEDEADNPKHLLTVKGRGFRFIP